MEIKTNKINVNGDLHGYWENDYEGHHYNGLRIGYFKNIYIGYRCHYIDWNEIGCEQYQNSQFYYNKPGKKFGESIKWKE